MNTDSTSRTRARIAHILGILLVLFLAFGLRIWGLTWSLPKQGGFSFHPDEIFQVAAAIRIDFFNLQLDPGFYNYGTMYFYMISVLKTVGSGFGIVNPGDIADVYVVARAIAAVLGSAIPLLVYLAAAKLYDKTTALLAAALVAITPLVVLHSHFATVDIPAAFWLTACLTASAVIGSGGSWRALLAAGLCAGFAGATKYTAGLVVIAPIVVVVTASPGCSGRWVNRVKCIFAMLLAALVGFIIGNPGSVLWTDEFLKGFTYELRHAQAGHGLVFVATGTGWLFHLTSSLRYGLGMPLLLLSLAGVLVMALDRSRRGWFLIAFGGAFYLTIGAAEVRFARYAIPLVPVLSIAAALAITRTYGLLSKLNLSTLRRAGLVASSVVFAGVFYYTFSYSSALNSLFTMPDPRVETAQWVRSNAEPGSTIALPATPWFYSPAFSPEFTHMLPSQRLQAMSTVRAYRLITNGKRAWDWQLLEAVDPDYVIISDYEYVDAFRAQDPDAKNYLGILEVGYSLSRTVANRLRWGGISFGSTMDLPHDMKYASPTLTIYRRRS